MLDESSSALPAITLSQVERSESWMSGSDEMAAKLIEAVTRDGSVPKPDVIKRPESTIVPPEEMAAYFAEQKKKGEQKQEAPFILKGRHADAFFQSLNLLSADVAGGEDPEVVRRETAIRKSHRWQPLTDVDVSKIIRRETDKEIRIG